MSDVHQEIADLQGDVSNVVALVPQILSLLQEYHDKVGQTVDSGDMAALAQMHADMGPQIEAMQTALEQGQTTGQTAGMAQP